MRASGPPRSVVVLRTLAVLLAVGALSAVLLWPSPQPAVPSSAAGPLPAPSEARASAAPAGYPGFAYDPRLGAPTRDNPQSKLWFAEGSWWALLVNPRSDTVNVFELTAAHAWRDTGTVVDPREDSTADALWDGRSLHVASRTPGGSVIYVRASYDPQRRGYVVESGFPVTLAGGGTTSVSLDVDALGRPWATFVQGDGVQVAAATAASGRTWTAPYALPFPEARVTPDDQASLVTYAGGRVAVLWSNQRTGSFHLATRADGAPLGAWDAVETPVSGALMSDGHVQLVALGDGRLLAAVKTSRDDAADASPQDPLVLVLERSTAGQWTTHAAGRVADGVTRPRLVVSESERLVRLYTAAPSPGGRIYEKLSPLDSLRFAAGRGRVVLATPGGLLNHVTTTKQHVGADTGVVLLVSDDAGRRYQHAELATPG